MTSNNTWSELKSRAIRRLLTALEKGLVDWDIIPLLLSLNSIEDVFTLSSCSGRVIVLSSPEPHDKARAVVHGKWHYVPPFHEFARSLMEAARASMAFSWCACHSYIVHVVTKSLTRCEELLSIVKSLGAKYSGVSRYGNFYLLTIRGEERIDILLTYKREPLVSLNEDVIRSIYDAVSQYIRLAKRRLYRIQNAILKYVAAVRRDALRGIVKSTDLTEPSFLLSSE